MAETIYNMVLPILTIAIGIVIGKAISKIISKLNERFDFQPYESLRKMLRLLELGILLISIVIALAFLNVSFAQDIGARFLKFMPSLLVLVLLCLLGFVLISLGVDFIKNLTIKLGDEYFREFGVSATILRIIFGLVKTFLMLIFISISLRVSDLPLPIFDSIITVMVFAFILLIFLMAAYAFKDYFANFLLASHVAKNILKPGQQIKIGEEVGEVTSVTHHGAVIEMKSGYSRIIPNTQLVKENIVLKRVRSDIHKLEPLIEKFITQLPSNCGPASASMMLDFFGFKADQQDLAKLANTKVAGDDREIGDNTYGTEPGPLIDAVKKITDGEVKGELIKFRNILNLKEEVKLWLTEGALVLLWYKKPVLFPDKESRSGHFVLAVGVEGEEIVVMDPSKQTAGVFLINHKKMEQAMDMTDKERGYIVFAKKGTPGYWRLTEGLLYSDLSAYKTLSKSFERYLKKTLRESRIVKEFLSASVIRKIDPGTPIKHIWKPNLSDKQ